MEETGFEYKADMGKSLLWINIISIVLIIGPIGYLWLINPVPEWFVVFISIIVLASIIVTYFYSPKSYVITPNFLLIKRVKGNSVIEISKIREAYAIDKNKLKNSIRLWGSGGLFGYIGLFRNKELGRYTAYCTDLSKLILIKADKNYVISPSNPHEFLSMLQDRIRK